jgi:hypothetical protein
MLRVWLSVLLASTLTAVEPSPVDQAAMQDVLRRYIRAVNDCDEAGAKAAVAPGFLTRLSWTRALSLRLLPTAAMCQAPAVHLEVTVLARLFNVATPEVTMADGYFRTIGLAGGDQAGRVGITFVKTGGAWKVFQLRFQPANFEPPYYPVVAAGTHAAAGAGGWTALGPEAFQEALGGAWPEMWRVEDGVLHALASSKAQSLRTRDTYRSFELEFEWKTAPKGNSGVKYRLFYLSQTPGLGSDGAGYEYQVADDAGDPGAIGHPVERTGALYNQIAPRGAMPKPVGEFNQSRLVVRGRHSEHWLNGVKVMEFDAESEPPESPILLQHHTSEFWFRNLRVRRLD